MTRYLFPVVFIATGVAVLWPVIASNYNDAIKELALDAVCLGFKRVKP